MEKDKKHSVSTNIQSERELEKEVDITIDEINVENSSKASTDEEVKSAIDLINPDEASMDSRG